MTSHQRRGALAFTLVLISLATLVPMGGAPPRFFSGFDWSDIFVNIALYLPLGFLLAGEQLSPVTIGALVIALSGGIELLQGTVVTGRRGSAVDVACNFLGAMAGVGLARLSTLPDRFRSRSMIAGVALLASLPLAAWGFSGMLLRPAAPETRRWWGQWAHEFLDTEPFRGSILSVSLLGHPVPDDAIDSTPELIREVREKHQLLLEVTLISGGPTSGRTHLASVADGEGHGVIGLEQQGTNLTVSWWSKGSSLGLRGPQLVFRRLLSAQKGERITIKVEVTTTSVSVSVGGDSVGVSDGVRVERTSAGSYIQRFSPLEGWRNLIPTRELSAAEQRAFTVVWTLGCLAYVLLVVRGIRALRLSWE